MTNCPTFTPVALVRSLHYKLETYDLMVFIPKNYSCLDLLIH